MDSLDYPATVVIVTRNRPGELRRALGSVIKQDTVAEIIVVDDASADGTTSMVCREFPQARLLRYETSAGYIVRRNEAFALARAPVIFSIDDDAEFTAPDTVRITLSEFTSDKIGAVAIPFLNVGHRPIVRASARAHRKIRLADTFTGTAFAVRKSVFLKLSGFRQHFIHQGEERDFCIRMLNAGFYVRRGASPPIRHHLSPVRDRKRMDFYGRRNDVLFCWHNVPFPWLVTHLNGVIVNSMLLILRTGRPWIRSKGLACGLLEVFRQIHKRKPVSTHTYKLTRRLRRAEITCAQGTGSGI